jgi:hypothetical protein
MPPDDPCPTCRANGDQPLREEELRLRDAALARAKRFFLVWTIVKFLLIAIVIVALVRFGDRI